MGSEEGWGEFPPISVASPFALVFLSFGTFATAFLAHRWILVEPSYAHSVVLVLTALITLNITASQKTVLQTPLRARRGGQHPHDDGREPRGFCARDGWDEGAGGEVGWELGRCVCFCISSCGVFRALGRAVSFGTFGS